jgi:hypothetical protein
LARSSFSSDALDASLRRGAASSTMARMSGAVMRSSATSPAAPYTLAFTCSSVMPSNRAGCVGAAVVAAAACDMGGVVLKRRRGCSGDGKLRGYAAKGARPLLNVQHGAATAAVGGASVLLIQTW